jgi:hypothetical protein
MKYKAVPLSKVAKLDDTTFRPSGNTALYNAVGNTVQTVSTDGYDKVITIIMTDGEENSSREWSLQAIRELIRSKEAAGNWTFMLLGANLDAFAQVPASACRWRTLSATIPLTIGTSTPLWPRTRTCSQPVYPGPRVTSSKEKSQASRSPDEIGE